MDVYLHRNFSDLFSAIAELARLSKHSEWPAPDNKRTAVQLVVCERCEVDRCIIQYYSHAAVSYARYSTSIASAVSDLLILRRRVNKVYYYASLSLLDDGRS